MAEIKGLTFIGSGNILHIIDPRCKQPERVICGYTIDAFGKDVRVDSIPLKYSGLCKVCRKKYEARVKGE